MLRIVLLGTGTGVGKTRVAQLLLLAFRIVAPARSLAGVKPIETGISATPDGSPPAGSDALALEVAGGTAPLRPHPIAGFTAAVSPHLAARNARKSISIPAIAKRIQTLRYDICVVEMAGAAFSPLGSRSSNVDLARALDPAFWILVAPDALGVLHDVRAATIALTAVARAPDHLVLCASRTPDASTGTNAAELPRLSLPRPAATVPWGCADPEPLLPLARLLLRQEASTTRPARSTRARAPKRSRNSGR